MELGFIGLGRMGKAMAGRLAGSGHRVVVYDMSPESVADAVDQGAEGADNLEHLARELTPSRIIWMMVPAGKPVDEVITALLPFLKAGDLMVDGGNSNYKDSMRRASQLTEKKIDFLDIGTSGGLEGAEQGWSFMAGGAPSAYSRIEPLLKDMAWPGGYARVGGNGAGHFVKTVHNGIEYALLESYAEGFELLKESRFDLDLAQIAGVWNNGGVVRSWLLALAQRALERDHALKDLAPEIGGGETGRWAVESALELGVPLPMTSTALFQRYQSKRDSFAARLVAALRREFGGHPVTVKK